MRVEWFPGNDMEERYACIIRRRAHVSSSPDTCVAVGFAVRGYGSCPENAVQFAVAKVRRIRHAGGL